MTIKLEYLKTIKKTVDVQAKTLAANLDNYDCVADEEEIKETVEALRYLADLVESIPIS